MTTNFNLNIDIDLQAKERMPFNDALMHLGFPFSQDTQNVSKQLK